MTGPAPAPAAVGAGKENGGAAAAAPSLEHVRDGMLVSEVVTLENLGLNIYYNVWADKSTRSLVASAELMFGANKAVTGGTIASVYNP